MVGCLVYGILVLYTHMFQKLNLLKKPRETGQTRHTHLQKANDSVPTLSTRNKHMHQPGEVSSCFPPIVGYYDLPVVISHTHLQK